MHSRPLEFDDFPIVVSFMETLEETKLIDWMSSKDIKNKIKKDIQAFLVLKFQNLLIHLMRKF